MSGVTRDKGHQEILMGYKVYLPNRREEDQSPYTHFKQEKFSSNPKRKIKIKFHKLFNRRIT